MYLHILCRSAHPEVLTESPVAFSLGKVKGANAWPYMIHSVSLAPKKIINNISLMIRMI